jgi:hypothetical protein
VVMCLRKRIGRRKRALHRSCVQVASVREFV